MPRSICAYLRRALNIAPRAQALFKRNRRGRAGGGGGGQGAKRASAATAYYNTLMRWRRCSCCNVTSKRQTNLYDTARAKQRARGRKKQTECALRPAAGRRGAITLLRRRILAQGGAWGAKASRLLAYASLFAHSRRSPTAHRHRCSPRTAATLPAIALCSQRRGANGLLVRARHAAAGGSAGHANASRANATRLLPRGTSACGWRAWRGGVPLRHAGDKTRTR